MKPKQDVEISISAMPAANMALIVAYLIVATGAKNLSIPISLAAPAWALSGLALATVMVFGFRILPGIFLGTAAGYLWQCHPMDGAILPATGVGLGAASAAAVSAMLLRRRSGPRRFESIRFQVEFIFFGAIIGAAISATIGSVSLIGGRLASWNDFSLVWLVWWLGAFCGILTTTPVFLTDSVRAAAERTPWRRIEKLFAFLMLIVINMVLFRHSAGFFGRLLPLHFEFIVIPLLFYIALRFDLFSASLAVTITAAEIGRAHV